MKDHGAFNITDAAAISVLVDAVEHHRRVRWLTASGAIADGVARAFTRDGGGFIDGTSDVRDAFLHVSGSAEWWLPVENIMRMARTGEFVVEQ